MARVPEKLNKAVVLTVIEATSEQPPYGVPISCPNGGICDARRCQRYTDNYLRMVKKGEVFCSTQVKRLN